MMVAGVLRGLFDGATIDRLGDPARMPRRQGSDAVPCFRVPLPTLWETEVILQESIVGGDYRERVTIRYNPSLPQER